MYRGLSGGALPASFRQPAEFNFRGGVEFGCLSVTSDRAVALSYAQGAAGLIFEVSTSLSARPADLSWCSQYPFEAPNTASSHTR